MTKEFRYFQCGVERYAYISQFSGDLSIGNEVINKDDIQRFSDWLKESLMRKLIHKKGDVLSCGNCHIALFEMIVNVYEGDIVHPSQIKLLNGYNAKNHCHICGHENFEKK